MKRLAFLVPVIALLGFTACKKNGNGMSNIPNIRFLSVNPDHIRQGEPLDTAWVSFYFEDGDADIHTNGQQANIVMTDLRNGQLLNFSFPYIPAGYKDPVKGMKGSCLIGISGSIVQLRDTIGGREKDTIQYELYIFDEAGNHSNTITTTPLYIDKS